MSAASGAVQRGFSRLRLWPRSLAARTSLLLIVGLGIVQAAGLAIHAIDHVAISDRMAMHEAEMRVSVLYRAFAEAPPDMRPQISTNLRIPAGYSVALADHPDPRARTEYLLAADPFAHGTRRPAMHLEQEPIPGLGQGQGQAQGQAQGPFQGAPPDARPGPPVFGVPPGTPPGPPGPPPGGAMPERGPPPLALARPNWPLASFSSLPETAWPRRIRIASYGVTRMRSVSLELPDERAWVIVHFRLPASSLFGSITFIIAFGVMTVCGGTLIVWGANRLIAPVGTLALAAETLGRNVDAPPLPENGPAEIRRAAVAFNTMASRIRRFVTDRTLMLTAIGHDLRTPITRLKLRAEFIDDDELRDKFLADLDEMEAMVAATLAFGRDSASREPITAIDLTALLQTIVDESIESHPALAEHITLDTPDHAITIQARSLALKRALANLVLNAIKYGASAHVTLEPPKRARSGETLMRIVIEDEGPGLPEGDLERMFEPFVRAETSRNRETGGTGLGLSIARTILRGHGGDVTLHNREQGGCRALVTLPA